MTCECGCIYMRYDANSGLCLCIQCGDDIGVASDLEDDEDEYEYAQAQNCPHCNGTGVDVWTGLEECEYCDGYGYKWWE